MGKISMICGARSVCSILSIVTAILLCAGIAFSAEDGVTYVNGFHVHSLPISYTAQEQFFSGLKGSGANTVILALPVGAHGAPDMSALSNLVYLVHQSGFRIFIVMPTRRLPRALEQHPEWEDRQYDLAEGSVNRSEKLDLFQNTAVAHLAVQATAIAEHAVDGILLAEDFLYETGDGFGKQAIAIAEKKLQTSIAPKKLFAKIDRTGEEPVVVEHGPAFWQWTELKRDRLLEAYEAIRTAARKVNPGIKIGVPVPVVRPVATPHALLARYAFDSNAYRRLDVDLYWTAIDHRDRKAQERLTFSESVQILARSAYAAVTAVKETTRMIIVLQASTAAGRAIPLSEIEQSTELVRRAGRTGIAYSITPATVPSGTLTKKMFHISE